jgi:hypothetical protein
MAATMFLALSVSTSFGDVLVWTQGAQDRMRACHGPLDIFRIQHVAPHHLESLVSLPPKHRGVSHKYGDFISSFERLVEEVPTHLARSPKNRDLHVKLPSFCCCPLVGLCHAAPT